MLAQKLIEAAAVPTGDVAEAIDFDGTNDYLSRSSDLTGNADGGTFTFSAWVWLDNNEFRLYQNDATAGLHIGTTSTRAIRLYMSNSGGGVLLDATATANGILQTYTFFHVLVSIDLSNSANRYIYINDIAASVTWTTYSAGSIDWTRPNHYVAYDSSSPAVKGKGRASNIYLDYTYRDLSVTNNRRLFITADLKPADGQASLNPILYLPMDDPTQPGLNAGTGGNFTPNGTIARSGRGPNQYNAPYSDLDGSADYLSRTSLTGLADGKQFTLHCTFSNDAAGGYLIFFGSGSSDRLYVGTQGTATLIIQGQNSTPANILTFVTAANYIVNGRNYVLDISIDLTSTSKRHVYLNGVSVSGTWSTYTNDTLDLVPATSPGYGVGATGIGGSKEDGRLGAVWFNTSYIDLSVAANLAKFVTGTGIDAKPVDLGANGELPTGSSPLIYLPMYGNNAGKNYGTGGDFTVNSGPYTGARGPNEFWGNKADFDGTTGYLSRTSALSGVSDGKIVCGSFNFTPDAAQVHQIFTIKESGGVGGLEIAVDSSGVIVFYGVLTTPTAVLNGSSSAGVITSVGTNYSVQYCIDLSNTSKRFVYVNNSAVTMTWSTYTNSNINLDQPRVTVGARYTASGYSGFTNGKISEFYFTTDYIDFSQEANRLKFRDAFGNPVNLTQQIADAAIPNPAIYMRFDPASFGTNTGTGGNFTVNGTITDGGNL